MSVPESHQKQNRRDLRKALIRLRMEMHRQEIRQESSQLMQPLYRMRGMSQNWQGALGIKHAPLWGMGVVTLLGFLSGKGARSGGSGGFGRILKLGVSLLPVIRLALQGPPRKR
ncbi:hypothetical protein [Pseudomonas sp. DWP3-1-2]|uniref:hypothetical protein n=1 Tax=Pseudomonas sp. DWP3-1-2 TaxID=2804645 RepID=UPI003CF330BF